ncbi:MAG: phosphonate ABC transporter, permease protein PhnE [Trueperaceae bacterium]|nr:phosphonate ABC transporter, permease protein PhnE [Trueperaceae bacterium]
MSTARNDPAHGIWRPPPLVPRRWLRYFLYAVAVAYAIAAAGTVEVDVLRMVRGLDRVQTLLVGFLQPDFVSRWTFIQEGILESIAMTVAATIFGIMLSVPFAFGAARNVAPLPVYLACRAFISISRSFQEIVIAIVFVVMVGFGPFAGVLTLAFATIGFLGKLLAEDIEDTDPQQLEAMRASGAGWLQQMSFAIVPQIMPRFVGLSVYRLDINFRESSVIGIVGAGGIGGALNTSVARYEYGTTAAIILVIVVLVLITEYASGLIRKRVQ